MIKSLTEAIKILQKLIDSGQINITQNFFSLIEKSIEKFISNVKYEIENNTHVSIFQSSKNNHLE